MARRGNNLTAALMTVLTIVLGGCGGGSGTMDRWPAPSIAAQAIPNPGSVAQSSNVRNGTTVDTVDATARIENGAVFARAEVRGGGSVSIGPARFTVRGWHGDGAVQRTSNGDLREVNLFVQPQVGTDADYLVGGWWATVPSSFLDAEGNFPEIYTREILEAMAFGVFMDGSNPLPQSAVAPLTGSAIFEGTAIMSWIATDEAQGAVLSGLVSLTADFDAGTDGLGTVGGAISDFRQEIIAISEGLESLPSVLRLETAPIGDDHSGFFTGETSMTFRGRQYGGKWGGQFYGSGGDAMPMSAAGTFGVTTADGNETVLGVFGAHHTP
ncbi:MAG: hypothetical protein OXL41_01475 [Nitrospinae bacterium]|nr:hypothetical protein [Nitrospinota bacterium]MDE0330515.1 hypothetical protein [Nitrospinota bacterium]